MKIGDRVQSLQRKKYAFEGGTDKTVHIEQVEYTEGNAPYYKTAKTVIESVLVEPRPIIRQITHEDIAGAEETNLQLGDFIFEIAGSAITEEQLKHSNQVVLGKNTSFHKELQILQYTYGQWDPTSSKQPYAIMGKTVQRWFVYARGQVVKP